MTNKCQKLKSIKWKFELTSNDSDIRQLLSPFETFPTLKRLYLTLNYMSFDNFNINQWFSFEAFKGLLNITHLTLGLERNLV